MRDLIIYEADSGHYVLRSKRGYEVCRAAGTHTVVEAVYPLTDEGRAVAKEHLRRMEND